MLIFKLSLYIISV